MTLLDEIKAERRRQVEVEGWSAEHDDKHDRDELARAAACYAAGEKVYAGRSFQRAEWRDRVWPWAMQWWKPADKRRNLVKAAALIVAEIERLDRAALRTRSTQEGDTRDDERD